jgi:arylsulfatase A-like enzyme
MRTWLAVLFASASMAWTPAAQASEEPAPTRTHQKPNFLIIVADDMGFSDLGAFGGEIATPNLDAIAARGVRLTNFHTAPTCSPTRAMLLTGEDPHRVGLGAMAEMPLPEPRPKGYEGYLHGADTVADRLQDAGYSTFMSGKWHLGQQPGQWPESHGFDRSFALHQGGEDHFGAYQIEPWSSTNMRSTYSKDGKPAQLPIGTYAGDYFADQMLEFLKEPNGAGKPFFAYLAFTDPHWPLQAPSDLIAKYRGRYDAGPAALRAERLEKLKREGLAPPGAAGAPIGGPEWSSLSPAERARSARAMEIYAAMVERMDTNVGRVLDELRRQKRLDDTVIVFLSDNGADGSDWEGLKNVMAWMHVPPALLAAADEVNQDPEQMGRTGSFVVYGPQWATAATAPFRNLKGSVYEGGVRAPAFISGPGVVGSRSSDALLSVRDLMPTVLQLADVPGGAPQEEGGGRSWVPLLVGQAKEVRKSEDVLVQELMGRRMVLRQDGWKAVFADPQSQGMKDAAPRWQLYQTRVDPSETTDLAQAKPAILNSLIQTWRRYAATNGIIEDVYTKAR